MCAHNGCVEFGLGSDYISWWVPGRGRPESLDPFSKAKNFHFKTGTYETFSCPWTISPVCIYKCVRELNPARSSFWQKHWKSQGPSIHAGRNPISKGTPNKEKVSLFRFWLELVCLNKAKFKSIPMIWINRTPNKLFQNRLGWLILHFWGEEMLSPPFFEKADVVSDGSVEIFRPIVGSSAG